MCSTYRACVFKTHSKHSIKKIIFIIKIISYLWQINKDFCELQTYKIASCETQGPSGSKHGSAKGTPARKRKTSEKNKGRKNSTEGGGLTSSQTTRGGLRIYKVVVLGDGGVGKSGENFKWKLFAQNT